MLQPGEFEDKGPSPRNSVIDLSSDEDPEEGEIVDAKPLGEVLRQERSEGGLVKFFNSFTLDTVAYHVEETVLVTPPEGIPGICIEGIQKSHTKPYVMTIKQVKQLEDGSVKVLGRWFYRPEDCSELKAQFGLPDMDARELFYSFHEDEIAAETIIHHCVVHHIPTNKQLPSRPKHKGHVVRKVYDTAMKKLWKLTDKNYEDSKQREVEALLEKTRAVLGDLDDIETDKAADIRGIVSDSIIRKGKRQQFPKIVKERRQLQECRSPASGNLKTEPKQYEEQESDREARDILRRCGVQIVNEGRSRWVGKLLQAVKHVCDIPPGNKVNETIVQAPSMGVKRAEGTLKVESDIAKDKVIKEAFGEIGATSSQSSGDSGILWPDAAVPAVRDLENCAHELFGSDVCKYNSKMRSMRFNLKNCATLARRLLQAQLTSTTVLSMSASELKEGRSTSEKELTEAELPGKGLQMTDKLCQICGAGKIGLTATIILIKQANYYELVCSNCGHSSHTSEYPSTL